MTEHVKLSLQRPLVGLRSHGPVQGSVGPRNEGSRWLLDLGARARREAERDAAFDACLQALSECVATVTEAVQHRLEQVAVLATELGLTLAREVLGAAVDRGLADPTPAVLRCLRDCAAGSEDAQLTVCLAPEDLGPVLDRLEGHVEVRERPGQVRFTGDPGLERGSVRLVSRSGQLLYEPAEVLQRICGEVRRELSE